MFILGSNMFNNNLTAMQKLGAGLSALGTGINIAGAKNIIKTQSILKKELGNKL
jgi:hypothetical protein